MTNRQTTDHWNSPPIMGIMRAIHIVQILYPSPSLPSGLGLTQKVPTFYQSIFEISVFVNYGSQNFGNHSQQAGTFRTLPIQNLNCMSLVIKNPSK